MATRILGWFIQFSGRQCKIKRIYGQKRGREREEEPMKILEINGGSFFCQGKWAFFERQMQDNNYSR